MVAHGKTETLLIMHGLVRLGWAGQWTHCGVDRSDVSPGNTATKPPAVYSVRSYTLPVFDDVVLSLSCCQLVTILLGCSKEGLTSCR